MHRNRDARQFDLCGRLCPPGDPELTVRLAQHFNKVLPDHEGETELKDLAILAKEGRGIFGSS